MPIRTILPHNYRLIPESAKLVFKGIIHDVYHWQQEMFDGTTSTFEMLKRADTIHIVAIKDHKLVVLKEQQPSFEEFYGLPGGRHDVDNETEFDAARREMREETGMSFSTWRLLDVVQPNCKTDYFTYLFLAYNFESQTHQSLDSGEKIEVTLMDRDAALELSRTELGRYLPAQLLANVKTIDELAEIPEFGS